MKHDKPAKGLWFAYCCVEDVQQVETEDQAAELQEDIDCGEPSVSFGFYDTRDELLAALE